VEPGSRLGPYEILAPIGKGGMGEVWRARDPRLGREVAVKVLLAGYAADPGRLRRFEQEARSASALNHPNILTVHDVGAHEGAPYLVTELLEGESLRGRLRRGALTAAEAAEVARQVARGLAAAHAKRIVHRDIKPENVFLTVAGVVKILDFGLAKLAPAAGGGDAVATMSLVSEPGLVVGTLPYMAPEQLRGEPVDHRADLFSFGCVLHEMLSGSSPFLRESAGATVAAVLGAEPPPLAAGGSGSEAMLADLVRRCLAKQAEERCQTAAEVAAVLEALPGGAGGNAGETVPTVRLPGRRRPRRQAAVAALAVVALLGAAGAVWLVRRAPQGSPAPDPRRVVVAAFENRTGDAALDAVGAMAADWITQGLAQAGSVEVVPTTAVFGAMREDVRKAPAAAAGDRVGDLAAATGAGTVVTGAYYLRGDELQVQATITDAVAGRVVHAISPVSGPRRDPGVAVDAARSRIVGAIAAPAHDASLDPLLISRPPVYEAYREYLAGVELFGVEYAGAIERFRRAIELDGEFLMPRLFLIACHFNLGEMEAAAEQNAILEGNRQRLSPLERHTLDWSTALLAGRRAEALTAARAAAAAAPASTDFAYFVAVTAYYANRPREAVERLSAPLRWDRYLSPSIPYHFWYFGILTEALHLLGEHQRELAEAQRARETYPEILEARAAQVRALAALGRVDEVTRVVEECLAASSRMGTPLRVMVEAALELRAHGHREAALRFANRATAWLDARPAEEAAGEGARFARADALCLAERFDEARKAFEALAAEVPDDVDYQGYLGALAARRGDRATADRTAARLEELRGPYHFGHTAYWQACIAAQLGDRDRAVERLREALASGYQFTIDVHRDPDLAPLHGFPPFDDLIAPHG